MLTEEEAKRFDVLFEEVLDPFFQENQKLIDSYIEKNPTLKEEITKELESLDK